MKIDNSDLEALGVRLQVIICEFEHQFTASQTTRNLKRGLELRELDIALATVLRLVLLMIKFIPSVNEPQDM